MQAAATDRSGDAGGSVRCLRQAGSVTVAPELSSRAVDQGVRRCHHRDIPEAKWGTTVRTQPTLPDDNLLARLRESYGVDITSVAFLPLGADYDTALYRVETRDGTSLFCRLRSGAWNEVSVELPAALHAAGVPGIIAPLRARDGRLSARLAEYRVSLLPWVEARNAYEAPLSDAQWVALGAAVCRIHEAALPEELRAAIPAETFPDQWRTRLRAIMAEMESTVPMDTLAEEATGGLRAHRHEIIALLARTEALAAHARSSSRPLVLCHTDLHAGNVLVTAMCELLIVDWDAPLRAPRERDLMYAGGGQFANHRSPAEEETLFYAGYGDVPVARNLLSYYRYARIIEDLAIYADDLLRGDVASPDRAQALHHLLANFAPGGTLAIARAGDRSAGGPAE
jgi:spectinomycin phosphotransferase